MEKVLDESYVLVWVPTRTTSDWRNYSRKFFGLQRADGQSVSDIQRWFTSDKQRDTQRLVSGHNLGLQNKPGAV